MHALKSTMAELYSVSVRSGLVFDHCLCPANTLCITQHLDVLAQLDRGVKTAATSSVTKHQERVKMLSSRRTFRHTF